MFQGVNNVSLGIINIQQFMNNVDELVSLKTFSFLVFILHVVDLKSFLT